MLSKDFSRFDDAKRGLAKLMAKENITVQIINGAPTASFDMVARVLTLPDWPGLTNDQLDLLIGHEVGHSLHTDTSYIGEVIKSRKLKKHPGLMSYINVVEDARIERKQREAYPGLMASFYGGYRDFTQKGPIFKIKGNKVDGKDVDGLSLIDRINVFYKLGAFIKVSFTPDEEKWIEKIDKAWSTERAVEIAKELHELAKDEIEQQQKDQKEQQKNQPKQKGQKSDQSQSGEPGEESDEDGDEKSSSKGKKDDKGEKKDSKDKAKGDKTDDKGDEDKSKGDDADDDVDDAGDSDAGDDAGDADGDDDTDGESGDEDGNDSNAPVKRGDLDPASETDKALADALKKLAEAQKRPDPTQQIRHLLLKPLTDATVRDRTVTAEEWAQGAHNAISRTANGMETILKLEQKWNDKYLSTAENMAQEFLRRKTAKNLLRARTAKSGRLDMTKLAKYKFADDLFRAVTVIPNGQSHGIVMIIDGSSSMSGVFGSVLDQVLLFAHFAHKTRLPFECYMFSNANDHFRQESMGLQTITLPAHGSLIGLVNTVSNPAAFKKQVHAVLAYRSHYVRESVALGKGIPGAMIPQVPYSRLGNTPLYAGMMIAERHVERMKRTLRLDKVMTVVISDGQDNGGLEYERQDVDDDGNIVTRFAGVTETAIVVRDTVTKLNHVLVEISNDYGGAEYYTTPDNGIMTLFFDVLKSRHGCRNIYLYLTDSHGVDGTASHAACRYLLKAGKKFAVHIDAVRKSMNTAKQFVMPVDQSVADCAMVVQPDALQLTDSEFASWNASGASQKRVAEEFVTSTVKAVANRVFVNSVIPHLA